MTFLKVIYVFAIYDIDGSVPRLLKFLKMFILLLLQVSEVVEILVDNVHVSFFTKVIKINNFVIW